MSLNELVNVTRPEAKSAAKADTRNSGLAAISMIVDPLLGYAESLGDICNSQKLLAGNFWFWFPHCRGMPHEINTPLICSWCFCT